jgi:hypothetical protein
MPAPGKPFELFVFEDRECRQFAQQSIGTSASQASTASAEKSIAAGTALGAVAGILRGVRRWSRCGHVADGWRTYRFGFIAL